jgi:DNA replication and repair protein RecF
MLLALQTRNFRNLKDVDIELSPQTTVFIGDNGQGKTNILESAYLLSYGKPFRGSKEHTIMWGEEETSILGKTSNHQIRVEIQKPKDVTETKVYIDNKPKSHSKLFGVFVSVSFFPEEIDLLTGPPSLRRSFIDKFISTQDRVYLSDLVNYQKSLRNRNRLLKNRVPKDQIKVWDESLAKYGSRVWERRGEALKEINETLKTISKKLVEKNLFIDYSNPLIESEPDDSIWFFKSRLEKDAELEARLGITVFGPHRDDFKLIAEEEVGRGFLQKDLANYGSRAQQRQGVVLLKLAQAVFFTKHFGEKPTIILDDVTSELDEKNKKILLTNLYNYQLLISTTTLESLPKELREKTKIYEVEKGSVTAL